MTIVTKIIKNPRITEKASSLAEGNVYTFDISDIANKNEVKKAIFELYKVHPLKVNIINIPAKKIFFKGKFGKKTGTRKAVVYLKKEDKIEFV